MRRAVPTTCLAVALSWSLPALGHPAHTSYCSARQVAGGLDVTFEVPLALTQATAQPALELEGHVRASTPSGECRVTTRGPTPGQRPQSARFELDFSCPEGPITLGTDYGMAAEPSAEVVCAIDEHPHVFRQGALDYAVGTPPSRVAQLGSFIRLGALHVFSGLDHVLFVLSLVLGAASSAVVDARRALRRVVAVVTGFTLGHSVTLLLAALAIVRLPSALTESLIALSIVLVALQNLFEKEPRGRAFSSASFGLIHGFGFAGVLAATGLPRQGAVGALLAFNVGIELAQLLLVAACLPVLVWTARRPWFRARLLTPACCLIAALASIWFLERALGWSVLPFLDR